MDLLAFAVALLMSPPATASNPRTTPAVVAEQSPAHVITSVSPSVDPGASEGRKPGRAAEWAPDPLFQALARCESTMRQLHGPTYWGYFSMKLSTARAVGLTGLPTDHSYREQEVAAREIVRRWGWGQFPSCSRKIGAR